MVSPGAGLSALKARMDRRRRLGKGILVGEGAGESPLFSQACACFVSLKRQPREERSCAQMPRSHVPTPSSQGGDTRGGSSWRGAPPTKPPRSASLLCPVRGTLAAPALEPAPWPASCPSTGSPWQS